MCLDLDLVCSGFPDCPDGRDERGCTSTCAPGQYTCPSGSTTSGSNCIDLDLVCDRRPDCPGGEDEQNCPLRKGSYLH